MEVEVQTEEPSQPKRAVHARPIDHGSERRERAKRYANESQTSATQATCRYDVERAETDHECQRTDTESETAHPRDPLGNIRLLERRSDRSQSHREYP